MEIFGQNQSLVIFTIEYSNYSIVLVFLENIVLVLK